MMRIKKNAAYERQLEEFAKELKAGCRVRLARSRAYLLNSIFSGILANEIFVPTYPANVLGQEPNSNHHLIVLENHLPDHPYLVYHPDHRPIL